MQVYSSNLKSKFAKIATDTALALNRARIQLRLNDSAINKQSKKEQK